MTLYLLRHAIAVDEEDFAGEDRERPLTGEGRRKMEKIARGMVSLGVHFDALISSPYVRARETAEIVAAVFQCEDHPEWCDALKSGGSAASVVGYLNKTHPAARSVLLVGHEPDLSQLASLMLTGTPSNALILKKGGLIRLALERPRAGRCATLEWLLTPKHLAAAA